MFSLKIGPYSLLSSEPSLQALARKERAVLCLHGMFGGAWYFGQWLEDFKRAGFGVLALDFRGHHGSTLPRGQTLGEVSVSDYADDVEFILGVLTQAGIGPERITLLGHSMGGLIAQMNATSYAPAALVLVASAVPVLYRIPFAPVTTGILKPADSAKTRRLFAGIEEPLLSQTLACLVPESGRAASEITNGVKVAEPRRITPTLILAGSDDPIIPTTFLRWLTQQKRNAVYREYPGGHFPMLQPNALGIANFISPWVTQAVSRHS